MADTRKPLELLLVVNVVAYVCVGFASAGSSSSAVHHDKKLASEVEEVETAEIPVEMPEVGENNEEQVGALNSGRLNTKRRPNGCPYCDSSVYSYCSDKLLHDACCCLDPQDTDLPNECQFADCSFLHSNTCREHRLITACCCNQFLAHKK